MSLAIVGCGGLGRETLEAARARARMDVALRPTAFIDEDPARHGTAVAGLQVQGGLDWLRTNGTPFVVAIGLPDVVRRIATSAGLQGRAGPPVVHPITSIGASCSIGPAAIVLQGVTMTADVSVGRHVVINPQCALAHDVRVADFAQLTPGVLLSGNVHVKASAYLGTGACVKQGVTIGEGSVLGAGAVALRDVPDGETWVGNPARPLQQGRSPTADAGRLPKGK